VVIDLKTGKLTYQDIGQIDFYVRYFEENIKQDNDNPTIGIVLCSEKNDAMVKYSVLSGSKQLFASKYMLYLPTEEELKRELERERLLIEKGLEEHDDKNWPAHHQFPHDEPKEHWSCNPNTQGFDRIEGRRPAGYVVAGQGGNHYLACRSAGG
jgi:hypothetical protein